MQVKRKLQEVPLLIYFSRVLALAVSCFLPFYPAGAEPSLLAPEKAFIASAFYSAEKVLVRYKIAPGYKLYKDRLFFKINTTAAQITSVTFSPSEKKYDKALDAVLETYRNEAVVEVSVKGLPGTNFLFTANSQGCADVGVCYPPMQNTFAIQIPK